jgi:hypothetical protein
MWVRNTKQPAWGVGEIVGLEDGKVKVMFSDAGEKTLATSLAILEEVAAPVGSSRPRLQARRDVDLLELERLCLSFHEQFRDRRANTDDGGMALDVLDDMKRRGDLTKAAARRLFRWCHSGESYAEGVDPAQQICRLIYGRVPTPAEVEAAGF